MCVCVVGTKTGFQFLAPDVAALSFFFKSKLSTLGGLHISLLLCRYKNPDKKLQLKPQTRVNKTYFPFKIKNIIKT
jgi:hypothetical protein